MTRRWKYGNVSYLLIAKHLYLLTDTKSGN